MKNRLLPLLILLGYVAFALVINSSKQNRQIELKPYEDLHIMRNYPDFNMNPSIYLNRLSKVAKQTYQQSKNSRSVQPQWLTQGPYNIGGRINTIAHNPGNDQIIYVGNTCGGIFKTSNGGDSWIPIFDEQPYLSIAHIVVSPHDTNTIYVGTGDPNITGHPFVGNGIYMSTDAGKTWQHLGLEKTGIVTKIAVHPFDEKIIYAATMGIPFVRDTNRGLYKTTDGGDNWEKVLFLSEDAGIIDMVMIPENPDTLIVAGWNRITSYSESVSSGSESKIYRTTDGGKTWDSQNTGLLESGVSRIGLYLSLQDTVEVITQFIDAETFETKGIFKSADFGVNWQKLDAYGTDDILGGFGWYFGKIRVNPYNKNQYFVLGVDLHKSEDGGSTFENTTTWNESTVHADKHDLVFIDSSTILLATDGGLYKSNDGGLVWEDIENIPNTQFYRVTTDPFNNGFYCGGAQDNGTCYGNINDSVNWQRLLGGDGFQPLFDWSTNGLMYGETQNGKLYYVDLNDEDAYWEYFDDGIEENDRRSWDMPICMSALNSNKLYTGTYRVYENNDAPYNTWESISGDLTDGTDSRYHVISAIEVSPINDNIVMAGTSDGRVHALKNGWRDISFGLPERYVTDVALSSYDIDNLFVTQSGYKANEYIPHIHFSNDFGNTWKDISGNLPQLAVNSLYVLYGYGDSVIFVATDGGVYHTLNQGDLWERTGSNMPVFPVYDLAYDDTNHILVAGTHARSLMTIELSDIVEKYVSTVGINEMENITQITSKLYPNPASSYFALSTNKSLKNAKLMVVDVSGKLVLTKELKQDKEWQVNVEDWTEGIYFVSVVENGKMITRHKLKIE